MKTARKPAVVQAGGLSVTFKSDKEFTSRRRRDFKRILMGLTEKPGKMAEIECATEEEAKAVQRGFHSSGTGRRLKEEGHTIKTSCNGTIVQVSLASSAA